MDGVSRATGAMSESYVTQQARNEAPTTRESALGQAFEQSQHALASSDRREGGSSLAVDKELREGAPVVRSQGAQQEPTITSQEPLGYVCTHCAHQGHAVVSPAVPHPRTPSPAPLPPPSEQRRVEQQLKVQRAQEGSSHTEGTTEKSSNPSQDSEAPEQRRQVRLSQSPSALARGKELSPNPDSLAPPPRPPKDRPAPSRYSSGATTVLLDTLPTLPRDSRAEGVQGLRSPRVYPSRQQSGIDYFVPLDIDEKTEYSRLSRSKLTVSERLQPTLDAAKEAREKFAKKARFTKHLQNGAIGLQVLLGSLTTGLSAVATTGETGGLTTIVASYLAKTRNSDEAERCRARVNDLDKYIRTSTAFLLDFGYSDEPIHDRTVEQLRSEFEELLGNGAIEKPQLTPNEKADTKV